jgi:hypothetical protein
MNKRQNPASPQRKQGEQREEAFPKVFCDFSIINLDMASPGLYNNAAR